MRIRFWGTRGSLAKPGLSTLRYGGNTSCVEARLADGTLVVFDCGTGAHNLGQALLATTAQPVDGHLLITHTHWDHIQGLPFFAPLFTAGNTWDIYAPGGLGGRRLEDTLAGQMEYTYFPVTLGQLGATIRYHDLVEGNFALGQGHVIAQYLNHPALTLGYRLEVGGVSVVYATDHEPHTRHLATNADAQAPPSRALELHHEELRHIAFLADADLVIHDSQYTAVEYPEKTGWGHSTVEYAVDVALAARVKRLALFHHDPLRHDDAVDRLVELCYQRVAARGGHLEVFAAAEGQIIELLETTPRTLQATEPSAALAVAEQRTPAFGLTVLIVDDEPDIVRLLTLSLRPEGFRLLSAHDGDTALQIAHLERPALILMDWNMPGRDGLEVCRLLRAMHDPQLRDVPIVLLTAQSGEEHIEAGFAAGVTDYLTKPFNPAYVRSRVREWLLRTRLDASDGV